VPPLYPRNSTAETDERPPSDHGSYGRPVQVMRRNGVQRSWMKWIGSCFGRLIVPGRSRSESGANGPPAPVTSQDRPARTLSSASMRLHDPSVPDDRKAQVNRHEATQDVSSRSSPSAFTPKRSQPEPSCVRYKPGTDRATRRQPTSTNDTGRFRRSHDLLTAETLVDVLPAALHQQTEPLPGLNQHGRGP